MFLIITPLIKKKNYMFLICNWIYFIFSHLCVKSELEELRGQKVVPLNLTLSFCLETGFWAMKMKKKKKRKRRKEYGKEKQRRFHLFPLIRFHIWNQCSALEEFFALLQQKGNCRSLLILLLDQQFVLFFIQFLS